MICLDEERFSGYWGNLGTFVFGLVSCFSDIAHSSLTKTYFRPVSIPPPKKIYFKPLETLSDIETTGLVD